jgi:glucoamylase
LPLEAVSHDQGALFRASHSLILAHEDKSYPGALIAALSIPWGDIKGDEDLGGYHLVWTRDLCHGATALLASGDTDTPLRSLIYLACTQRQDGGFYKNFWIDGRPYSYEVPLDDVAHPILLAWRLKQRGALRDFDPYLMVMNAAGYLVRNGPSTPKERWEEISGYSPSTLAVVIAALLCAADFAKERNDTHSASYLEDWADFLEAHIETWTYTEKGELLPGEPAHYMRARACAEDGSWLDLVTITNQPPGAPTHHLASNMIDAGFLELVRYGIRSPNDSRIEASLRVVDHSLKVETPAGPVWRRFPYDGYGQQDNGDPFVTYGRGRAWPLLTAERGLYELACGRDASAYIKTLEQLANRAKLLPQQVWDAADIPARHMHLGKSTGAAMPFLWAHAEYLQLLRSMYDKEVYSVIPFVRARYSSRPGEQSAVSPSSDAHLPTAPRDRKLIWKWSYQVNQAPRGTTLRIQAETGFVLHCSHDNWQTKREIASSPSSLGVSYVDLLVDTSYSFTFYWPQSDHWEGRNFSISAQ